MNFSKIKYFPEAVFLIILLLLSCGGVEDLYNKVSKSSVEISDEETEYFRVTYNGNGNETGNVPVDENSYKEGDSFTVQGNPGTLALTGYSFNGWNIQSNGDGDFYDEKYSFTIGSSDVTFFAQWLAARWAKTVTAAPGNCQTNSVAADASGNVYIAGYITGNSQYGFNEVSIAANPSRYNIGSNIMLVKYNSSGIAQWAKSIDSSSNSSVFSSIAVDNSGNIYAAGSINNSTEFDFGDYSSGFIPFYNGQNLLLVKYDSNGFTQWAKSVSNASYGSSFASTAVDQSGNVYAAGQIYSDSVFTFESGKTVSGGTGGGGYNIVLVKYNSSGSVLWAKSVPTASSSSSFASVTTDPFGNIYAAGLIQMASSYNFGDGVISGTCPFSSNILLVKYDSAGNTLWSRTVHSSSGTNTPTAFTGVSVDSDGNVFASGYLSGTDTIFFADNVFVAGINATNNILLVKYNSSGTALWAKTVTSAFDQSKYNSVSADSTGNVYAVGFINGNSGAYSLSDQYSVTGRSSGNNVLLVKYSSSGAVQWAKTVAPASCTNLSTFVSVAFSKGSVFAGGYIANTLPFDFGNGASVAGIQNYNMLLVKYR